MIFPNPRSSFSCPYIMYTYDVYYAYAYKRSKLQTDVKSYPDVDISEEKDKVHIRFLLLTVARLSSRFNPDETEIHDHDVHAVHSHAESSRGPEHEHWNQD